MLTFDHASKLDNRNSDGLGVASDHFGDSADCRFINDEELLDVCDDREFERDPSPSEIAATCLEIQRNWSDRERSRRKVVQRVRWNLPTCRVDEATTDEE